METHFENIRHAHNNLARERVLTDLRVLVRDSEDLLKVTAHDVSEKAGEARAHLTAALERTQKVYERLQAQTSATARAAAQKTDTLVREYPYQSLGAAFGIGLLLGVLISRPE